MILFAHLEESQADPVISVSQLFLQHLSNKLKVRITKLFSKDGEPQN